MQRSRWISCCQCSNPPSEFVKSSVEIMVVRGQGWLARTLPLSESHAYGHAARRTRRICADSASSQSLDARKFPLACCQPDNLFLDLKLRTMSRLLGRIWVGGTISLIAFLSYSSQLFVIWPWYGREMSVDLLLLLVPFK